MVWQVKESWVRAHERDSMQLSVQVYIVSNVTGQCLQVSAQAWEYFQHIHLFQSVHALTFFADGKVLVISK